MDIAKVSLGKSLLRARTFRDGGEGPSSRRNPLHQGAVHSHRRIMATRLELCTEFTKPDSLCIRSMGTPKNHRSPPA
jgi:hypothetical protein